MAYEMTTAPAPGQTIVQTHVSPRRRMSRWWPVSFFIAAIVFFIVGGGLMGAWASSYSGYGYYTDGNWYAAIACFVIASILKLTAWILLIVWCVGGSRRTNASTTVTYVNSGPPGVTYTNVPVQTHLQPQGYAPPSGYPQQGYVQPQEVKPQSPAPVYQSVEAGAVRHGEGTRYCGGCGVAAGTPFCAHCGGKVF